MSSNIINALGIFGRLEPLQEAYFKNLQQEYYNLDKSSGIVSVFPHLTLVASYEVSEDKLSLYLGLLKKLKAQLPLTISIGGTKIVDGRNVALTFDVSQTRVIRELATSLLPQQVIVTNYFTVMREVPEKLQPAVVKSLSKTKSLTLADFKLCANQVDDAHILHSSSE